MTSSEWHILIVAIVAYTIGYVSGKRSAASSGAAGQARMIALPPQALPVEQWPPYAAQQFERYLQQGKKIEAIKVYREQTGVDLLSSKNAVEAILAGAVAERPS